MTGIPGSRRVGTVLVLIVVLASVGSATASGLTGQAQTPSGDEILERVEQRYETADTVAGRAVVTTTNGSATVSSNVSFAFARPDSSRFVFERDGETFRTGSNGTVAWVVGPQGSVVWDPDVIGRRDVELPTESAGAVSLAAPVGLDAGNLTGTLVGSRTLDGTPTYEVRVQQPGNRTNATTRVWVTKANYTVRRVVTTDGANRTVVDVTQVWFDVSIHESTFQPPADRIDAPSFARYDTYEEAQNATTFDLPRLEDGTLSDATVTTQGGETIVVQRYEYDGANVTLVSTTATGRLQGVVENATNVRINGRDAAVARRDSGFVVVWTEDDVSNAVVVPGSAERAVAVATRLIG